MMPAQSNNGPAVWTAARWLAFSFCNIFALGAPATR
jgi:hypothetical protein